MRTRSSSGFNGIPENVAAVVFSHLGDDPRDRVALAQVSKVWRDAEKSDASLPGGSLRALFKRGERLYNCGPRAHAIIWWRLGADRGDVVAMYVIAHCYHGMQFIGGLSSDYNGVKQDHTKAFELWERASERGHADATHCLATSYELGLGVKVNETKGMELHVKAVELGSKDAAYYLGNVYLRNVRPPTGVALNKKEALKWFRVAVELGCNRSVYWMTGLEAELAATQTNTQNFESFDEDKSMTESLS